MYSHDVHTGSTMYDSLLRRPLHFQPGRSLTSRRQQSVLFVRVLLLAERARLFPYEARGVVFVRAQVQDALQLYYFRSPQSVRVRRTRTYG